MRQGEIAEKVGKFSEGVLNRAVDLTLVSLFYKFDYNLGETSNEYEKEALDAFSGIGASTFTRALTHLRQLKLVIKDKDSFGKHKLTELGEARLKELLPQYHAERIWDERLYLINYEVPVGRNVDRNSLRDFLKSFGCGMLQSSSWLWHYNPKSRLDEYVASNPEYKENIFLSAVTSGELLGGRTMKDVANKVYSLSKLSDRYGWFVGEARSGQLSRERIIFKFLAILADDPQAPYELLPEGWMGYEAWEIYKGSVSSY